MTDRCVEKFTDARPASYPRVAVVELVIEPFETHELDRSPRSFER